MTYRDGGHRPKEFLEIIIFMLYERRVISRSCYTTKKA